MNRRKQLLVIALVAATLCAEQALAAAPSARLQTRTVAGRLVTRLSVSLQRVVPSVRVYETRRDGVVQSTASILPPTASRDLPLWLRKETTPYKFRLPPPQAQR
jgi:hypothetical protein